MDSGAIPADSGAIPVDSGAIPADSGAIPADSGVIPVESSGMAPFLQESVGQGKVLLGSQVLNRGCPHIFGCQLRQG
jgi:hypothetical protein